MTETVAAVITTAGRSLWRRAVDSAFWQTHRPVEVILVDDSPDGQVRDDELPEGVELVRTGGQGGCAARNAGVRAARAEYVAFLDDDDVWFPRKTEVQLAVARSCDRPEATVVSCRAIVEREGVPEPRTVYKPGQDIAAHLFHRRWPHPRRRPFLQTSSLLVPRKLLLDVPFKKGLGSHQDWDWLIRAGKVAGLVQVPSSLYLYSDWTPGGVAGSGRMKAEQEWAIEMLPPRSPELFGYFFVYATAKAQHFRDWPLFTAAVCKAWRYGRPSSADVFVGLSQMAVNLRKPPAPSVQARRRASSGGQ